MKEKQSDSDPLWDLVQTRWKQLVEIYEAFREKTPILELDPVTKKILAYPLADFITRLDATERSELASDFDEVRAGTKLLVVISDANEQTARVCFSIRRRSAFDHASQITGRAHLG